ncbi:MAG: pyridoxamine 5'-phosphate oxidase family protein [Candidatus Heimdallarchaeota archaeon]|nr:pyridoxamine 5'-phosphate oxidase family protein [Candidatus Heimdallarchaeota archaeon]
MPQQKLDFSFIEKKIREKTFGILNTLNSDGTPHTTGILYGVSNPKEEFALYMLTSKKYRKTKNIQSNNLVSFIIPFPHHYLRFVPSGTITINGKAEVLPVNNKELLGIFEDKRILQLIIKDIDYENDKDYIFIKIIPNPKILCYAVGFNILKLRGSHTAGGYSVSIPDKRR